MCIVQDCVCSHSMGIQAVHTLSFLCDMNVNRITASRCVLARMLRKIYICILILNCIDTKATLSSLSKNSGSEKSWFSKTLLSSSKKQHVSHNIKLIIWGDGYGVWGGSEATYQCEGSPPRPAKEPISGAVRTSCDWERAAGRRGAAAPLKILGPCPRYCGGDGRAGEGAAALCDSGDGRRAARRRQKMKNSTRMRWETYELR